MFKQQVPRIGLSLEQNTDAVPKDGRFYIVLGGERVSSFTTKSAALARYRELREALISESGFKPTAPDPQETLRREREFYDLQGIKAESREQKVRKAQRKGGKGKAGRSG